MRTLLYFLPLLCFAACVNPPDFPEEPIIQYVGMSKTQIRQNQSGPPDSLTIQLSFTDGDGDLSQIDNDTLVDIFFMDSRLGDRVIPGSLPLIPSEGTGNGISGDIFLRIVNSNAICCIRERPSGVRDFCFEDPAFPVDTFSYTIQIMDRAGNLSNAVRTDQIEILCLGQ